MAKNGNRHREGQNITSLEDMFQDLWKQPHQLLLLLHHELVHFVDPQTPIKLVPSEYGKGIVYTIPINLLLEKVNRKSEYEYRQQHLQKLRNHCIENH